MGYGGGQRYKRWPPLRREGCGGRPGGAVSPRFARRDGAPRTPEQPDPSAARGTPQKLSYNKAQIGITLCFVRAKESLPQYSGSQRALI